MLSDPIRQLARTLALTPRTALSYEGRQGTLTIHLELHKVPGGFGAKLTLSPQDPHLELFATARPLWLLDPEALLLTGDPSFDAAVALRAPPELLGLFDHVHRRGFAHLLAKGEALVEAGRLIATIDQRTRQELEVLVALGHRLCLGRAAATTCLDLIARTDPHPAVREQAQSLAAKPLATSSATRSDLELEPSSAELRALVGDALLDPITRLTAFAKLMRDLPWADSLPLIAEVRDALLALHPDTSETAHRDKSDLALEWLLTEVEPRFLDEDLDGHAAATLLASVWGARRRLPKDLSAESALRLARLCARVARPELTPCILALLGHPSRQVRFEALRAIDALDLDAETLLELLGPEHHLPLIELAPELAQRSGRGATLLQVAFRVSFRFALPAAQRLALITSMTALGDPKAEPFLWDRLEDDDGERREAAIEALGACGTHASLIRLEPHTTGLFRPASTKALARAAIARILERLGPIEAGALALSPPEAGGLALDDDP